MVRDNRRIDVAQDANRIAMEDQFAPSPMTRVVSSLSCRAAAACFKLVGVSDALRAMGFAE